MDDALAGFDMLMELGSILAFPVMRMVKQAMIKKRPG